jgi:hypothetical protein
MQALNAHLTTFVENEVARYRAAFRGNAVSSVLLIRSTSSRSRSLKNFASQSSSGCRKSDSGSHPKNAASLP